MDGRQIARELPDSAGEILAALSTEVARISEDAKKDPAQFVRDVQNAEELVQHLTQEIRTTSYLLHRSTLDESGISPALRWYPHALAERSSLALAIDLKVPEYSNLGKRVRRISIVTRESKTALIRIEREEKTVPVTVEDQGRGCRRKDSLRFSPTAQEWESEGCASACAIFVWRFAYRIQRFQYESIRDSPVDNTFNAQ